MIELSDAEKMTPKEMRAAGENAASVLRIFDGLGIPSDAHAAIVDLSFLLHVAIQRLEALENES